MTSFFSNIGTTAEERGIDSASNLKIEKKKDGKSFTISNGDLGKKNCKIMMNCEDANSLLSSMKTYIEHVRSEYKESSDNVIEAVKGMTGTIEDEPSLQKFLTAVKKLEKEIGVAKDKMKKELKTAIDQPPNSIKIQVFIKGKEGRHNGYVKSFNIADKTVNVTYKNAKDADETLKGVEIAKICIIPKEGDPCSINAQEYNIAGGARLHRSTNESKEDYQIICE